MKKKNVKHISFEEAPESWSGRCSGDGYDRYVDANGNKSFEDCDVSVGIGYRPCAKCGEYPTLDGDDHCISNLGRVTNACCGHGKNKGYIQFDNGITIRGYFEVENSPKIDIDYQIRPREEILNRINQLRKENNPKSKKTLETLEWVMSMGE